MLFNKPLRPYLEPKPCYEILQDQLDEIICQTIPINQKAGKKMFQLRKEFLEDLKKLFR